MEGGREGGTKREGRGRVGGVEGVESEREQREQDAAFKFCLLSQHPSKHAAHTDYSFTSHARRNGITKLGSGKTRTHLRIDTTFTTAGRVGEEAEGRRPAPHRLNDVLD